MAKNETGFRLEIPLDASQVDEFKPEQQVKVALLDTKGVVKSEIVTLTDKGLGSAGFDLEARPGHLRVVVGPADASDEELVNLQTISLELPARHWRDSREFKLPVVISTYYWRWWLRWCRTFVITGKVVCPDGQPVPGATVCAFDVDYWWWWSSLQQVGCTVTAVDGSFTMKFRWCCGWWPWWWWKVRTWQLEPSLLERIAPILRLDPSLKMPVPKPMPDLKVFEELLAGDPHAPTISRIGQPSAANIQMQAEAMRATDPAANSIDLTTLGALRERLLERLPKIPDLEQARIWPWWHWQPWWDCSPDIIFKVTQDCHQAGTVIVNETVANTRWNIATSSTVTLEANDKACCIHEPPPPEGDCLVITDACVPINNIGGNLGAPAAPLGFANPGLVNTHGDSPFAGAISISGQFGSLANVDYYEFEYATSPVGPWTAMPVPAAGGFNRLILDAPSTWTAASFNFSIKNGRNVIESREHYEATNPGPWGVTRFWTANTTLLMQWITQDSSATYFDNGPYYLRLRGYQEVGGNLQLPGRVLPICNSEQDNSLVLMIDNRQVASGLGSDSPCYPTDTKSVHLCTFEPDTAIRSVKINGQEIGACSNIQAHAGQSLDIEFVAHDPDGHLAEYSLIASFGINESVDLIKDPSLGATLTFVSSMGSSAPFAVGPDYPSALAQGAISPIWHGGVIRLHIPDVTTAFKKTCCYQLELRASKRTIVDCNTTYVHNNLSEYSFTVII
jgi:hypothetical protein